MTDLAEAELAEAERLAVRLPAAVLERVVTELPAISGRAGAIRSVFEGALSRRRVVDKLFEPLSPFVAPGLGLAEVRLAADAPAGLWTLAIAEEPKLTRRLMELGGALDSSDFRIVADELCTGLSRRLATQDGEAVAAARLLALCPAVRAAAPKLAFWTHHLTAKSASELRTAFAGAARLSDDAGPLFLEAASGHLAEPCQVLRLIALILDQPTDQFLADCALGPLTERLIQRIEAAVVGMEEYRVGDGRGRTVGGEVVMAAGALLEFDQWVEVGRVGPWGARLAGLRRALALAVEAQLKATPKIMAQALPTRAARWTQRSAPRTPRLSQDPDLRAVTLALDQAAFLAAIRRSPSTSGFAALLARTCEELDEQLDGYVEGLLELLHRASAEERPRLEAFLDVAARLTEQFGGAPAGRIVRRRAAAA